MIYATMVFLTFVIPGYHSGEAQQHADRSSSAGVAAAVMEPEMSLVPGKGAQFMAYDITILHICEI